MLDKTDSNETFMTLVFHLSSLVNRHHFWAWSGKQPDTNHLERLSKNTCVVWWRNPSMDPCWGRRGIGCWKLQGLVIQVLTWWKNRLSYNFSNDAQLLQDGISPYFCCIVCHFVNKCRMTWHAGMVWKVTRPSCAGFPPLGLCEECCMSRDIFRPWDTVALHHR